MVSEQDISELWDAVNAIRGQMGELLAQLKSLTAVLSERCETRGHLICSMDGRIKALEDKYHLLDKTVLKVSLITGAASAVVTSVVTAVLVKLAMGAMGAH